jgi:hypothetical protein
VGSPKIEAKEEQSAKRGGQQGVWGNGFKGKVPPHRRKLTQSSESFRRWVAEKRSRARRAEREWHEGTG